jgi:multidrug efflux system membrane fusion protein
MKPSNSLRVAALLTLLAVAPLSGCHQEAAKGAPPTGGPSPAPVHVTLAEAGNVPVEISAFGNVEALSTVELKAQVSGEVQAVQFKEGDEVAQGQELFKLDPRPFEAALAQAEANAASAGAQALQAEAMLRENEVRARNAQIELERNQTLLEREIVTQEEFDQSRTMAEAMRASSGATAASVSAARENIRAAEAAIETARLDLSFCTVRSPMQGRTGKLMVHQGDLVTGGNTPMVLVTQMKPINVSFTVPERHLTPLREAMAAGEVVVHATVPQSGKAPVRGVLSFIDSAVDRATSTIRLKAAFENADEHLWPGQYVDVRVALSVRENAISVPAQAVQTGQKGSYVYVVSAEQKAELRPVTTGPAQEGRVVIESGLQAGESVVLDGHLRVAPGGPVKVLGDGVAPEPAPQ